MLYAGLDIGTTHCKMLLCDSDGALLWEQRLKIHTHHPKPGWQEQDPREIWLQVQTLLQSLSRLVNGRNEACRITISTAMHAIFPVDQQWQPMYPMMIWADLRSQPQVEKLKETSSVIQLYNITGTPLHPMSPLCKIIWYRDNYPDQFDKVFKWVSAKDWIWWQITGMAEADHSVASASGLMDIRERHWSAEALGLAGIRLDQLPDPVSVYRSIQPERIAPGCGDWLHLPEWRIGGSDGFLATVGSGAVKPGDLALTIGTSGAVRVLVNHPVELHHYSLFQYAADEGRWLLGGAVNNGGNLLAWFSDVFLQGTQTPEATMRYWLDRAATVPPGSEGLCCLPWVYGERAPVWDAGATASFSGIRAIHGKEHFLRAVLEGSVENLARIVQALEERQIPIERIYASGGFLASQLWVSIVEARLGRKMIIAGDGDASARGAVELGRHTIND